MPENHPLDAVILKNGHGMSKQLPLLTGPVRVRVLMVQEEGNPVPSAIRSPADASQYANELRDCDREMFAVILLTTKNAAIGLHVASVGTIDASLVSPANVFKPALLANAAAVILCHNHPSRDPTPSAEDIRITRQLVDAGKIMDIKILDHIVLGGAADQFVSLREAGLVTF